MTKDHEKHNELIRAEDITHVPGYYYVPSDQGTAYRQEQEEEDERIHLLDYLRVLIKRRWTILTIIAVVLTVTAIATWKADPVYRATLKLQIDPEQTNILPFKDAIEPAGFYPQSQEYLQTQFKVLASQTLADRVIRVLNLEHNPSFVQHGSRTAVSKTVAWFRGFFKSGKENDDDFEPRVARDSSNRKYSRFTRQFVGNLTVIPVRGSRVVHVSFDARDPVLAAEIVNSLTEQYIQMNFETKFDATTKASEFLSRQLVDLKAKVEKSEEELVRFSQQADIYGLSDKENVILQKLADLNSALTAVQAERIQKESVWLIIKQAGPGNFPAVLRGEPIQSLETNVASFRQQLAKIDAKFKPGWPEYDQVAGQLAEAEKQLASERQKAVRNVETEYQTALQREKLLTKALSDQKLEANTLNQNSIQYNIRKREVDTNKQLYDGLLQRLKEAGVSAGLRSNNIHVVDPAEPPRSAYAPNKTLNMVIALGVGLLLGVGLAFFLEYLDSTIKTPQDIDRFIRLPALGIIPALSSVTARGQRALAANVPDNGSSGNSIELITYQDTKSLISESYRNVRTSVLLSSGSGRPPRSLLITSSEMGEGKTTTAVNVAIALAQTGGKVIVLDCDMRNPRIHRTLRLENNQGMSSFLSGNTDMSSLIQQSEIPNLFAVPAGRIPPNPAELVGSPRMKQALVLLEEYFDHAIIDSPPVLSVTDARILGSIVDGVILVVKGGETNKEAVQRTKHLLQDVHAHIIGILLNNVDMHSADYYYYSRYYYYGYGKKYGYGSRYGDHAEASEESKRVS